MIAIFRGHIPNPDTHKYPRLYFQCQSPDLIFFYNNRLFDPYDSDWYGEIRDPDTRTIQGCILKAKTNFSFSQKSTR